MFFFLDLKQSYITPQGGGGGGFLGGGGGGEWPSKPIYPAPFPQPIKHFNEINYLVKRN